MNFLVSLFNVVSNEDIPLRYTTIHIVPLVRLVGVKTMLVQSTYKHYKIKDIIYKIRPIYIFRAK